MVMSMFLLIEEEILPQKEESGENQFIGELERLMFEIWGWELWKYLKNMNL